MVTDQLPPPDQWAKQTVGQTQWGERRRTRSAVKAAGAMVRDPATAVPQQSQTWKALKAVCLAALNGPFTSISDAFWDKWLETYRLSVHGIWANLVGRLGWQILFSACLQVLALLLIL